jgi:hypothetical protein
MRGFSKSYVIGTCLLVLSAMYARPARAVLNNNFETDYVYALRQPAQGGYLEVYDEYHDFALVTGDLLGATEHGWYHHTFSGTGNNDARLFLVKDENRDPGDPAPDDIKIMEINAGGGMVKTAYLGTMLGSSAGTRIACGDIRFSRYFPSSLFIAARSNVSGTDRGMVWEVDLGLTMVKNTYTGPTMPVPDTCDTSLRMVMIAIDDTNGAIYMTGRFLGEPDCCTGNGDLVAFDTSGGTTNLYTTLIDGTTYSAGDPTWNRPQSITFRSSNPTDGTRTILIGKAAQSWQTLMEFYLDTNAHPADTHGNLIRRLDSPGFEAKFPTPGQEDEITHSLWLGGATGGVYRIEPDDVETDWNLTPYYSSVDSPSIPPPYPPVIRHVAPDPDSASVGSEYVKQLGLWQGTPEVSWSLVQGPAGAQIDSNGRVHGWTPTAQDAAQTPLVTFEVQASNAVGADTEVWQVVVTNNGFRKDWVYMVRSYEEDGNIRVFQKETGEIAVADWTPPIDEPGAAPWSSLTFSGTGDNDARMFVIKPDPDWWSTPPSTDIMIGELNAAAGVVKTAKLGVLAGLGANNLGADVLPNHIRYSAFHNSLFIPVNPDKTTSTPLKIYEVNLSLSSVLNVYTGPPVLDDAVDVAIDPRNGRLYAVGANLNGSDGQGDLIAFDTSGGSTSSYTALIDGATLGDGNWHSPVALAYRGKNNACYRPTILVILKGVGEGTWPVLEFYLDQTDANGNLLKKSDLMPIDSGQSGQLDMVTGIVWLAGLAGPTDMVGLLPDDTEWRPGSNSTRAWLDAATPGGSPLRPSPCNLDVFADADRDGDVDQADFAVLQACFTGSGSFTLSDDCKCFDRSGDGEFAACDGDIDYWDYAEFEACATGPQVPLDLRNPPPGCHP